MSDGQIPGIILVLFNVSEKIINFFKIDRKYGIPLVIVIFALIFLIYPAVMLIIRMKKHPEQFSPEKLYGDYKYSPISSGVGPKVSLFFYSVALLALIILAVSMILK
jgi:hypothetical protein